MTATVVRRIEKGDYGPTPVSLINVVRQMGGPGRELQESAQTLEGLKVELARLTSQLSRNEPQCFDEQQPESHGVAATNGPVIVGPRPHTAPAFQRRDDLLAALAAGDAGGPVIRALTGMRGAGKSQTAAAYARSCIEEGWRLVAWVGAADDAQILSGLAEVAGALRLEASDPEGLAHAVRHWLEADGDQCLVVFDDAADVDGLAKLLPSAGRCHVVITSNQEQAAISGLRIPVDGFTPAQAQSFLAQRTGRDDDRAGAAELASSLGFLPLALAQAAAVIAEQRLDYPTFLARLREVPVQEYLVHVTGDPYPDGVGEAIALALDTAVQADRTGLVRALMSLMALLSTEGVPRALLYAAGSHAVFGRISAEVAGGPGKAVDDALGKLASASLVTFSADGSAVAGHPLTMRVVLERAAQAEDSPMIGVGTGAIRLLSEVTGSMLDPRQNRAEAQDAARQVLDLHQHFTRFLGEDDTTVAADLLRLCCWALDCLTVLHDGFPQIVKHGPLVVADCERVLGSEDPATLHARTNLATALYQAGQLEATTSTSQLNLAVCERVLGAGHKETLAVRHNLALAFEDAGNWTEAVPLWELLLADRTRELGPDDEDTIGTRNNLAHAYEQNGELSVAIPIHESVLDDCIRVLGPEHENTLVCRNNLARAYERAGRTDEATSMYEESLAGFVRLFGTDHPYCVQLRHNVAGVYRITGRLPEAIALYRTVIAERERILGDSHPDTLRSRANLGLALQAAGQLPEAIGLLERAAADRERTLGPSHPDTQQSCSDLALAYEARGSLLQPAEAGPP